MPGHLEHNKELYQVLHHARYSSFSPALYAAADPSPPQISDVSLRKSGSSTTGLLQAGDVDEEPQDIEVCLGTAVWGHPLLCESLTYRYRGKAAVTASLSRCP